MYNQPTLLGYDHYIWDNRRNVLYQRLTDLCKDSGILYFSNIRVSDAFINRVVKAPESKIIVSCIFEIMQSYEQWKKLNQAIEKLGKVCFVLTDNYLEFEDLEFVKFFSCPELLGITSSYADVDLQPITPSKLYNCFIQRVDSVRLSWFYFLYDRNLLGKGYVSCLMKQLTEYSGNLTGTDLLDYIHYKFQLDQLPTFDNAYRNLREQIPYQNFKEEKNLIPLILDSKYSLVLETNCTNDGSGSWHFTEKSLRALQLPSIPLLFMPAKGIKILKDFGLELGDHIDHLDNLTWQERQIELLNMVHNDEIEYNWHKLYDQCRHNQNILESWRIAHEKPTYFDEFFSKVQDY